MASCGARGAVLAAVALLCAVATVAGEGGAPLCGAAGGALGGFTALDFANDAEVAQDVELMSRVAVGLIDQRGLASFGANEACPGSAMPPLLGAPEVLEACSQVVAGTVYKLRFTAPVQCPGGLSVTHTALVDAEVFRPLPFLLAGQPAEPELKSAHVTLTPDVTTRA
mmetsp:Transcript_47577/g.121419  ORF Transcript_47577/g.121419 Transcript_47577/m.121419 type:complete len:168 (-) Transcript_47577:192-695(-)